MKPYFEVAPDESAAWHWCLWSANGKIIAQSPEGYTNKAHAINAVVIVVKAMGEAEAVVQASEQES